MARDKIVSREEAVSYIKDGATVATAGFVGIGFAEDLAIALEQRFLDTGEPKDLTLFYSAGQGDGKDKGLNHLAHEGMLKRVIGGHWGLAPKLGKLAVENKIEAYNFPQGAISQLFREIAGHRPGCFTKTGLKTFVDPRLTGGKINKRTKEDLVKVIKIKGEEYLWYKSFPIDVALIRGTTADVNGNTTFEREALFLEARAMAQATRNSGGIVIMQVQRLAKNGTLNAKQVVVPGICVDYIVVAEPEHHWQTFVEKYEPAFSSEVETPIFDFEVLPLNERKIIARRALREMVADSVINLGIGMPEAMATVAAEEGILDFFTLTVEPGPIGGMPAGGLNFGAAINMEALVSQPEQFDFYDGGGLDEAFLGLAQVDEKGDLNVSKFGPKFAGCGGFINITQNAKKVYFLGTFTTNGLQIEVDPSLNHLKIIKEGKVKKFVKEVEHITFSGEYANDVNQPVLYITERAVFRLTREGLELIEIAPGIDLQKDVLDQMEFKPKIRQPLKEMEIKLFMDKPVGFKMELMLYGRAKMKEPL